MRLNILDHGHRLRARLFIRLVKRLTGHPLDATARMALYRPQFFGDPMFQLGAAVLRGRSYWTAAEREFLATYSAKLNQCPFCVSIHTETTRVESSGKIDVDDTSSVRPQLAAVLPLLEKVGRTPDRVGRVDVDAVRAAGVPDEAIVDALYVNLLCNVMNRLASALGFTWESHDHVQLGAKVIHMVSYRLPSVLMR